MSSIEAAGSDTIRAQFVREPGLLPFRLGAFKAAVDAMCPIVPIALRGTRAVLPADSFRFRHAPIGVVIGSPLMPREQAWREIVRLREEARATIAREAGEPPRDG